MEHWSDNGIVLSARAHGEGGAVVSALTENHGRHAGYVPGGQSSSKRALLEAGNVAALNWQARVSDQMGTYTVDVTHAGAALILSDAKRLAALRSACALTDAALPERENHPGLYHGLVALIDALPGPHWGPAYVMWEIALLRELGFALDLSRCAAGGDADMLTHVSPKTGRAVSREAALPYADKLLPLPEFLKRGNADSNILGDDADVLTGLLLTGHFLEHWAFAHHTAGLPAARALLADRLKQDIAA